MVQSGFQLQNQANHGMIGELKAAFPALENWPEEVIEEHLIELLETLRHIKGTCGSVYDLHGVPVIHHVLIPEEKPGSFRKEVCQHSKKVVAKKLIELAGFPRRHLALTLEQLDAKEKVLAYIKSWPENKKTGRGLLIVGPTGVGKTQLVTALGVEIVKRYVEAVNFVHLADLCSIFRKAVKDAGTESRLERLVRSRNLLILDDVGAVPLSGFDHQSLNSLIDTRYREQLPTVFTANLSKGEMVGYIGERAVSRIKEMCWPVVLDGPDRREGR
ncbi:MAG: ATP-binding protein [Thermoanaerobacter sp.]|nr:ATP-binding protein [Thermoanaerobacter sp.]